MLFWIPSHSKYSLLLLPIPIHDHRHLPAPHSPRLPREQKAPARPHRQDVQIVQEFRAKLRLTEELISKLAFNLREIHGLREIQGRIWRKTKTKAK